MSNPSLRRYIWLTKNQRERLIIFTKSCSKEFSYYALDELLIELKNLDKRKVPLPSIVQITIKGLRLPKDILPVSICDEVASQLIALTMIDEELAGIIKPKPQAWKEEE